MKYRLLRRRRHPSAWASGPSGPTKPLLDMRPEPVFRAIIRFAVFAITCSLLVGDLSAATTYKKKKRKRVAAPAVTVTQVSVRRLKHKRARNSAWTEPTDTASKAGGYVGGRDAAMARGAEWGRGRY